MNLGSEYSQRGGEMGLGGDGRGDEESLGVNRRVKVKVLEVLVQL